LRLLADRGRFLEMGKTDIRDPADVARDHPGVWYRVFDLITDAGPDLIGQLFRTIRELLTTGTLKPPRVTAWPMTRARDALRTMSQARHVGKLVLTLPAQPDPDGTVLITGGTGTLGGHVAEHLITTCGIKHLVLAGRRGPDAPGAPELAARLGELGCETRIVAADVGDPDSVADLIDRIDPAHPLTGVVHAAGVLDDAVVTEQSPKSLERVWLPKAAAAYHLHAATAHLPLSMFVTFSSAAATIGSPGQANYAAANACCDALAAHRQAAGLPALSVGWGLWADASGMTGHLGRTDLARMARAGARALSTERALELLDAACRHGDPHLLAMDLDVRALSTRTAEGTPALLRSLDGGGPTRRVAVTGPSSTDWGSRLAARSRDEQHEVLLDLVRTHAAAVLGHAGADAVPVEVPFAELGFDSLTAVEVRNRLSAATGLRLPTTFVFRHPTASAVAEFLREQLCPVAADPAQPVFAELDRLENVMRRVAPEPDARGRLADRLEALLWRLRGDDAAGLDQLDQTRADGVLQAASDEELFELIDRDVTS
jgi:polyketide synthase 12